MNRRKIKERKTHWITAVRKGCSPARTDVELFSGQFEEAVTLYINQL